MIDLLKDRKYYFGILLLFLVFLTSLILLYPNGRSFFIVNGMHHSWLDVFFSLSTHLGDGITAVVLASLLLVFYKTGAGFWGLLGIGCVGLLSYLFKYYIFIDTPRPEHFFWTSRTLIHHIEGIEVNTRNSFPSGHTFTAFYISTFFVLLSIGKNLPIQLFAICMAIIAGYSRIYLAQHFLGDVLAGSILGVVIAIVFYSFYSKTRKKRYFKQNLMFYIFHQS